VHRLLKEEKGMFLFKGDNNWKFDSKVKGNQIIGKVTEINGKKTDSLKFELTRIPVTFLSYLTGKAFELKGKK
jgi:thiamine pyrophosphokinase